MSGFLLLSSGPFSLFSSFSSGSLSIFLLLFCLSLQGLVEAMGLSWGLSDNCNGLPFSGNSEVSIKDGNGEVSIRDGIGEESGDSGDPDPVDPWKSPEIFGPRFPGESRFAVRVGGAIGFRWRFPATLVVFSLPSLKPKK